jgi:hypothetical protein
MLNNTNLNKMMRLFTVLMLVSAIVTTQVEAQSPGTGQYSAANSISRDIMRSTTKRGVEQVGRYGTDNALGQKLYIPPLPGDQSFTDSSNDPMKYLAGENKSVPDFGANERESVSITLPALKGLNQILDSSVTKDLLKQLTASEAAVLMQTYMMVENGAATGFMGSMNIGTGLMSNLLQSQDYQLKLMEITDDTGKMREAYVKRLANLMQNQQYQDVWPAALYMASGDDGKAPTVKMKNLNEGGSPFSLDTLPYESNFAGPPNPNKRRLSEMLFAKSTPSSSSMTGGSSAYKNEKIEQLRSDFTELVGDVSLLLENKGNSKTARVVKLEFIAPQLDQDGKRRGVAATNWEEVKMVWENINSILGDLCEWKKENSNPTKQVFKMETSATTKDIGKDNGFGSPWELASSPDIPLTINVLEQLYTMIQKDRPQEELNCSELRLTANDIPDEGQAPDPANLNDCKDGAGCLRNRVILHLAFLTARSRTLHTYRSLYSISKRFATEPFYDDLVERVFARAFAGMNIDQELAANRARYGEFISFMAALAQGDSGAGAFFRPGSTDSAQPGNGGFASK